MRPFSNRRMNAPVFSTRRPHAEEVAAVGLLGGEGEHRTIRAVEVDEDIVDPDVEVAERVEQIPEGLLDVGQPFDGVKDRAVDPRVVGVALDERAQIFMLPRLHVPFDECPDLVTRHHLPLHEAHCPTAPLRRFPAPNYPP